MRRFLKALLILVIGLPVMAAVAYWYLQQNIAAAGISQLQLDFKRVTLHSASFDRIRFQLQYGGALHQVDLQNADIRWRWPQAFKPQLQHIELGPAKIIVGKTTRQAPVNDNSPLLMPGQWQLPDWLPEHIKLADTQLILPCPAGQCPLQLSGYLRYHDSQGKQASLETTTASDNATPPYWQSQLSISEWQPLEAGIAKLFIDLRYQPTPQPSLEVTVQQAQQLGLSLKQHFHPDSLQAVTELVIALSPPSPANQRLFKQWGVNLPEAWLAQFQQPVQLYSKLEWQLPADGNLSKLLSSHDLNGTVIARVPDPFYVPKLGLIQGELTADLRLKDQQVQRWQLNASGVLSELELPQALTASDIKLNPVNVVISAKASEQPDLKALPLQLNLSSSGKNNVSLESDLTLDISDTPGLTIKKATVSAAIAKLDLVDDKSSTAKVKLSDIKLNSELSGYWQPENWQLTLATESKISASLASDLLNIGNIDLTATDSIIAGDSSGVTAANSDIKLSVNSISHSALLSKRWQWQGKLRGNSDIVELDNAQLSNDAGLMVMHQLSYQPKSNTIALRWQLSEVFLLAGNPFATSFNNWPPLLSVNRGKISASGEVSYRDTTLTSANQLQFGDVAGIYDRSLFSGLNGVIDVTMTNNMLQLNTSDLTLNRLNHGIEMGPLNIKATAAMPLQTPEQLQISLQQIEMQIMQGVVSVNDQQLDFSKPENQLILELRQIDLASLLQQHPSSDLTGNGKLSGKVPITINAKGVSVSDGNIAAEAPGGRLQYQSASVDAMAKTNSNMKLVFEALENFQYTVLSSTISYDTSGKLNLGLKLQGSNPNLQQGRAINLNVNLEEDLPALITSLQLTNKLNEVITKRVQKYLKQQQYLKQQKAAAANGEKP